MVKTRALALAMLLAAWPSARAVAQAPSEYAVKAAFLYNFAKFTTWPSEAGGDHGPFVIAVLGRDPFGAALDETLRGKAIAGRAVLLRRVARAEDVGPCQIVFISDSERVRLSAILQALASKGVLTVGDMEEFAERGGVIRFKVDDERIRLEVNLAAAERSGLRISSQVLKLARIVGPYGGG